MPPPIRRPCSRTVRKFSNVRQGLKRPSKRLLATLRIITTYPLWSASKTKRNRMTSQSQKVLDIQKAVGERVKSRLPSILFKALVRQHERTGFRTGCTCKYCKEKRIVSHLTWIRRTSYYDIMSPVTYEIYKRKISWKYLEI